MKAFPISCIGLLVLCKLVASQTDYIGVNNDDNNNRDVQPNRNENADNADTDSRPSASERFLDLGSLFNKGYNTNNRPYYPNGYNPYYPQSGYNPQGYYPNSGYPSAAYPSAGGYPNTGYPYNTNGYGTNVLGGTGGFGGYGGYGGNGGLSSYYGYNRNDYHGNRNVGFGYYDGTNSNGFYRTRVLPSYVSGYRGYN